MKQTLVALFALIITQTVYGQSIQKIRKIVQVMPQQTFFLNGGMRATFGGKSRVYYQIDLPKNTVEWYYIFSTSDEQSPNTKSLNLVPQLASLVDPSGGAGIILSAIMCPTGSKSCDIYLMNRDNASAFMNKVDNSGGKFYYSISGSRQNYRNGTIQIRDAIYGTYYLGFKNPSVSTGIAVTFEVAALVEEIVIN